MTGNSNSKNSEPQHPEHDASASSPTKPAQLDLFDRQTGESERAKGPAAAGASAVETRPLPIFAHWASVYRQKGYWPRPITPGAKACRIREWQKPDSELSEAVLSSWLVSHANCGIGLLMGSPFPDGTTLGALDIDQDEYVRLGRACLLDAPSGRIGKKGAVFFVRVRGRPSNFGFTVRGDQGRRYGKVAECLFARKLCVIPPTVHPDTGQPYCWFGRPLHEVDFSELPILEMSDA
jgi:bifunctional DNA primase/polymerase-like protein